MVEEAESSRLSGAAVRLELAGDRMAVLAAIRSDLGPDKPLGGQRIALCGHVTAETAVQVNTLVELGAELVWAASSTSTTDDDIAELVRRSGVVVHGRRGMSEEDLRLGALAALRAWPQGPTMVLDEGAVMIRALHGELADVPAPVLASEKTPDGLTVLEDLDKLRFPVVKSDESFGKHAVDNPHGTAQSLVETIATVSGRMLAGKVFVVAGYGRVGTGVAAKARGLGARVIVTEVDATRALLAVLDGFEVLPMAKAAAVGDFFCTVTGAAGVIHREHFAVMKSGAVLANGGHLPVELDVAALYGMTKRQPLSPQGTEILELDDGRKLTLLGGGNIVNLAAGRGNASEVMDVTFASQVLALLNVLPQASALAPGLHPLPPECDEYVARALASSLGIDLSADEDS
ncbi:adenosylhomocysteinase [Kitasatospora sp. HPMI-4]|uniref:S-adenosyl-L-homocysteine hydrolase n=1 Tax=Streptomyces citricolor TaxID=212427 RepID=A0A1B4ZCA5_9ACTN|nr:S-adenosyl-L-homocysteine hydrolase [Streptomyces citricolor]BAV57066.1 S-adenosyl-L-homocysteine hydrolase [Streptomyces citricolor]